LYKTITISILSLFIVISIVLSPDIALKASLQGLSIWWHLVFPGLLPFLILYEMMTAFGLLHGINTLLSPLIKRSLKLPAEASMPLIISFFTGFPVGAEATANLLQHDCHCRRRFLEVTTTWNVNCTCSLDQLIRIYAYS